MCKDCVFHAKAFIAGRGSGKPQMTPAWIWVALALVAENIVENTCTIYFMF